MTEISQRVRQVREALGMSQTEFAKHMMYGRQHVSSIERGKTPPGKRFLQQLEMLEHNARFKTEEDAFPSDYASGRVNEDAPLYSMPPHRLPESRWDKPTTMTKGDPKDFAEAINMVTHLFQHHPSAFQAVMVTLRGFYEAHKEKPI